MTEKMGGGRLGATIHLVCPLVQKGGTHAHPKFAQQPFEEMGGTPINTLRCNIHSNRHARCSSDPIFFINLLNSIQKIYLPAMREDNCSSPRCPFIVQCSARSGSITPHLRKFCSARLRRFQPLTEAVHRLFEPLGIAQIAHAQKTLATRAEGATGGEADARFIDDAQGGGERVPHAVKSKKHIEGTFGQFEADLGMLAQRRRNQIAVGSRLRRSFLHEEPEMAGNR